MFVSVACCFRRRRFGGMAEKMRELNNGDAERGERGQGRADDETKRATFRMQQDPARRKFQAKPGQNPSREIKMDLGPVRHSRALWRLWRMKELECVLCLAGDWRDELTGALAALVTMPSQTWEGGVAETWVLIGPGCLRRTKKSFFCFVEALVLSDNAAAGVSAVVLLFFFFSRDLLCR